MQNHSNKELWKLRREIKSNILKTSDKQCFGQLLINQKVEADANSMILKITMRIYDEYPELSKYLEEMSVTIPSVEKPKISITSMMAYYNSLNSMLNHYILEHKDDR